jgi:hypothetical protein
MIWILIVIWHAPHGYSHTVTLFPDQATCVIAEQQVKIALKNGTWRKNDVINTRCVRAK